MWSRSRARMKSALALQQIPGVGPLVATAVVSAIGNGAAFHKGREFAAWLGLVPGQWSTGGKTKLLGISKRGNRICARCSSMGPGRWCYAPNAKDRIWDSG